MSKNLSRRDFLRGSAASALGMAAAGLLNSAAVAESAGTYKPGTYGATAEGMNTVTVTMTFDAEKITDVVVDVSGETAGIGAELGEGFAKQILESQGTIDAVSGATVTSDAVKKAVEACIAQAKGDSVVVKAAEPVEEKKSWRTAPDPVEESAIVENCTADVVVVGLGQSGLACSRAAIENGASVIALEKHPEESHAWTGGDFGHINSDWLSEKGIDKVDPVEMLNDWQLRGCNTSNPTLVMQFIKNCGETFDWFLEPGDEEGIKQIRAFHDPYPNKFSGQIAGQKFWNGTAQFPGIFFAGDYTITAHSQKVTQYAIEKGLQVIYGCDAQYLEKDDTGRVTGVIAKTEKGFIRCNAKKGVVLAAGDFSADAEMVEELCPAVNALNFSGDGKKIVGHDQNGQGVKMGVWAGGKLEPGPISTMGGTFYLPSGILGSAGNLWLDNDGKRFCNEAFGDPVFAGAEASRHKGNIISVFGPNVYEELQYFPAGHGSAFVNDPMYKANLEQMMQEAREAGAEGVEKCLTMTGGMARLYAADTLEQLADYLGLNEETKANFLASIERYNKQCEVGYDDDYGKDPSVLFVIKEGPFYGFKKEVYAGYELLCTTGGLWTDNNQNVYDETLEPIPGLYATGNCCGRRFGIQYTTPIAGVSVGMAQTLGRMLGIHLASL